jgi:hypothetical protein
VDVALGPEGLGGDVLEADLGMAVVELAECGV